MLTINVFDNYKEVWTVNRTYQKTIQKRNIFRNVNSLMLQSIENIENEVSLKLGNILKKKEKSYDNILSEYIYVLTNTNMDKMKDILFKTFSQVCEEYYNKIHKMICVGKIQINLNNINNIWKSYIENTNKLYPFLKYYNNKLKKEYHKTSFLNTIRYCVFYEKVIKQQYNGKFLFQHLEKSLGNIEIFQTIEYFEMYRCLNNIGILNNTTDMIVINIINENNEFADKLSRFIDVLIRDNNFKNDKEQKKKNYKNILKTLYITKYLINNKKFKESYFKYLSFRLLTISNLNIEFETEILNVLTGLYNDSFTNKMFKLLDDITISNKLNTECRKKTIDIRSEKYKGFNTDKNFLSKFNANILKMFLWKNVSQEEVKFNMPVEAEIYITIFNKFYENKYNNRKLLWKFDMGDSIVSFKGMDKTYNLNMTTLQMFILMFLNGSHLTISELQDKSGINIDLIEFILKGFQVVGIVSSFNVNNTIKYKQNQEFSHPSKNISLIRFMKGSPKPISLNNSKNEKKNETSHNEKNKIIKNLILKYITEKKIHESELYIHINTSFHKKTFNKNEIDRSILELLMTNIIQRFEENNKVYFSKYVENQNNNSNDPDGSDVCLSDDDISSDGEM